MSPPPAGLRNTDLLAIYLNDHLAASVGGMELVRRMINVHRGTRYASELETLLAELHEENAALRAIMDDLGLPVRRHKQVALWLGEKVSRLKLNGRLVTRSPLSDLVEFEFLASAVRAKRSGFESLREVADVDDRLDADQLDGLVEQANRQHSWLTTTRREVAARVFGGNDHASDEAAGD
ncbi:hypothetical protein QOZ88_08655 [Blastococcus sp. BMG 814]|uniref:Ferritin-like metal-binding protein YciE n=1 Tax=Blastococcus carthaginiensis TaxID=3050034 RepID=A0ABT9IBY6_9ACTN|nr:hypothetical protein [Blastococcus carthaginiensis]MDP5182709.1 hypothetical protein [Blastococcus carthaginiensis]